MDAKQAVGVFDSGLGGISVLRELCRVLPQENFIYYGDSANAPYGDKTNEAILALSERITDYLLSRNVKAIVIACNTATSAAAEALRAEHPEIPILGIEPAIKPAAMHRESEEGRYLVMATNATLHLQKFLKLEKRFEDKAEFISLVCPGLADLIETGRLDSPEMKAYLKEKLSPFVGKVDGVVLGCTHYPFIQKQIREVMGSSEFFDGAHGTAMQLFRRLREHGWLKEDGIPGTVEFHSSIDTPEEIALYKRFFTMKL